MEFLKFFYSIKFLVVLWVVLVYLLYLICDKENKLYYKEKYYTSLPSDLSPAKIKALINYGRLYPKDLVAEVMEMLLKNQLTVSKKNDKVILAINPKADLSQLKADEKFLLKNVFKMSDTAVLYVNLLSRPTATLLKKTAFRKNFVLWNKEVRKTLKEEKLFKSKKAPMSFGIAISLFYLILTFALCLYFKRLAYLILLILAVITFIYSLNISKRTAEGQKQYALAMAFKRSIKDMDKVMPKLDIQEAEKYLPYAISLGVYQPILNYLKENINEENREGLKLFNSKAVISVEEFEKILNKVLKAVELSIISTDFK